MPRWARVLLNTPSRTCPPQTFVNFGTVWSRASRSVHDMSWAGQERTSQEGTNMTTVARSVDTMHESHYSFDHGFPTADTMSQS